MKPIEVARWFWRSIEAFGYAPVMRKRDLSPGEWQRSRRETPMR